MTDRPDQPAWPAPGAPATVVWSRRRLATRVTSAEEEVLGTTLAELRILPAEGVPLHLEWVDEHGLHTREVVVAGANGTVLQLRAAGSAERIQRRRFFRAQTFLDATVVHGGGQFHGVALDLSEGGARLRVEGRSPGALTPVTTHLTVGGHRIALPGRLVRERQDARTPDVGVAFDELDMGRAEALRRQVFAEQLKARQNQQQGRLR